LGSPAISEDEPGLGIREITGELAIFNGITILSAKY
jgi:hypothetical protein